MEERALTEKLIAYDSSGAEGVRLAAGFVKGWLEARDIEARQLDVRGLPITVAEVGPPGATTVLFHGHLDVVPGRPGQFEPHVDGERLIGRGAYDMKGRWPRCCSLCTTCATRRRCGSGWGRTRRGIGGGGGAGQ